MYEKAVQALKLRLKGIFDCNVIYSSRETLFYSLSKEDISLSLPLVCYFDSNQKLDYNSLLLLEPVEGPISNALTNTIQYCPMEVSFNVVLVASEEKDYFNLLRKYVLFANINTIEVKVYIEGSKFKFDCSMNEFSDLSYPATGLEEYDFSSSPYFIKESSFKLETGLLLPSDAPYIKKIISNEEVE